MNTGRSLTDLAAELERQQESKKDFIAPTTQLTVMPKGIYDKTPQDATPVSKIDLVIPGAGEFGINRHAHGQLAQHVKVPQQYYDRMLDEAPELLAQNVNHWLHTNKKSRLVRTMDGNVRAFLSNRYRTIDNYDIAQAVLPVMKEAGAVVMSTEVTESHLYIKTVIAQRSRFEIKQGDWVEFGVTVSNSEIGSGSIKVEPFIYRLVCKNGMIAPDRGINKYHVGRASAELEAAYELFRDATREADDRAFFMKVQDTVRASFSIEGAKQIALRLEDSTATKVEGEVDKVIEVVTKRFSLTEGDGSNILRNLIEGGDLTQWGLANAITATANSEGDYEKATDFERIGGEIAFLPRNDFRELIAA